MAEHGVNAFRQGWLLYARHRTDALRQRTGAVDPNRKYGLPDSGHSTTEFTGAKRQCATAS